MWLSTAPQRAARKWVAVAGVLAAITGAYFVVPSWEQPIDTPAVLPFGNAGDRPDTDYLGEGISARLIARLSRLPAVRVKARTATSARGACVSS